MMNLGAFGRAALLLASLAAAGLSAAPQASADAPAPRAATSAPLEASLVIAPPSLIAAMAQRLEGQRFVQGDHALVIEDVAQSGRPWVGVVAARCGALWLDTAVRPIRLTGPLARPRLAGPGYLMWAIGDLSSGASGQSLELRRLGVLARPAEVPRDRPAPAAGVAACPPP